MCLLTEAITESVLSGGAFKLNKLVRRYGAVGTRREITTRGADGGWKPVGALESECQ